MDGTIAVRFQDQYVRVRRVRAAIAGIDVGLRAAEVEPRKPAGKPKRKSRLDEEFLRAARPFCSPGD